MIIIWIVRKEHGNPFPQYWLPLQMALKKHQIHDWAGFSACVVCREGSISVIQGYRLRYHPLGQFFTILVRVLTYIAQEHPPCVELLECEKRISESHFWWLKPRSTQLRDRTRNILESQGCQTQNCNEFEQFHCPTHTKKRLIQDSRRTALKLHLLQPALGPMFKRIFRPKHKLFKSQPNTNIMLFIFLPSPTRPSQKKTEKIPEKNFAFVSAGYRISHIPPLVSSIYDQELILFKKHKVGGWILPKLVCGSSWHECLNIMTMFTLLGRILSMMFDCSSSPKKQWWWNHNSPI